MVTVTTPALSAPPVGPPVSEQQSGGASPEDRAASATAVERLRNPMPTDRITAWVSAIVIALIAFGLRVWNLGYPNTLVFDETYYAKDAYTLGKFGYERAWPDDANAMVTAGDVDVFKPDAAFIVHPQLGKWLIAGGEKLFGMNSFGWRFSACVFGALLVLVTIRMVRRLSRSTLIGAVAGVLLTFDGLSFVMSRIALLDIFQAVFVVLAISLLLVDRDWFRARLARDLELKGLTELPGRYGPLLLWRPWRLAAWAAFGLACGTKWSTIYVMAAFGLLSVIWDLGARRMAGAGRSSGLSFFVDGIPAALSMAVISGAVYVSTWASWLFTSGGWDRDWGVNNPDARTTRLLGAPLASLWKYHQDIYGFHRGDFITNATHSYDAHPIGWLVLARPIGIDAVNDIAPGTDGCVGPDNCLRVISGIGTPVLWWVAVVCLVLAAFLWIGTRDWRFGVPIVGLACTWLPWFQFTDRPQFFFYAILIIPFSVTAVALCIGKLLGPPGTRRRLPTILAAIFVLLVMANFAYLYPVFTDELLPYPQWLARMWFKTWI